LITPILISRKWAKEHEACPRQARSFFKHYPRGLRLTRANLLRAAETEPSVALHWFTWYWIFTQRLRYEDLKEALQFLETAPRLTRSVARKRWWANALADALALP